MDKLHALEVISKIQTEHTMAFNSRVNHESVVTESRLRGYVDINLVFRHENQKLVLIDTVSNINMAREIASRFLNDCSYLSSSEIRGVVYRLIQLARKKADDMYASLVVDGKLLNRAQEIVASKTLKHEKSDVYESVGSCVRAMKELTWKLNNNKIVKDIPVELEEHLFKLLTLYYSETEMIDKWKMMHIVSVINT